MADVDGEKEEKKKKKQKKRETEDPTRYVGSEQWTPIIYVNYLNNRLLKKTKKKKKKNDRKKLSEKISSGSFAEQFPLEREKLVTREHTRPADTGDSTK